MLTVLPLGVIGSVVVDPAGFEPATVGAFKAPALPLSYGPVDSSVVRYWPSIARRAMSRHWRIVLSERSKRSEEHTSELQSLMRISYAVFCLKKKKRR